MTTTEQRPAGSPSSPRARRRWLPLGAAAVVAAAAVSFAVFAVVNRSPGGSLAGLRVSGIPANVPTATANLMGLSPAPSHRAPNFTLTDQHGKSMSLSSFRGHPVVLTFFDPRCVTMCPIMAQEFVDAERYLAHSDPGVVFMAVNVNRHALATATLTAFTDEHQLEKIPTWQFFTGPLATLQRVWRHYNISVATRIVHGQWTVVHTSIFYFIGTNGKMQFIASPTADYRKAKTGTERAYLPSGKLTSWGQGIGLVAGDLSH